MENQHHMENRDTIGQEGMHPASQQQPVGFQEADGGIHINGQSEPVQNPYVQIPPQSPYTTPAYQTAQPPSPQQVNQQVQPQTPPPYAPPGYPVQQQNPQWAAGQYYPPYPPYAAPPVQMQQNPYMPYAVPASMRPVQQDTTKPLAVLARRRMSREEYHRLYAMHDGGKTAIFIIAAILAILFSIIAIFYAGETGDRVGLWLTVGLSALSGIALLLYPIWRHVCTRRMVDRIYACQEDTQDEEMVTEIYADRIESIYSRGRSVVYYHLADLYETADMLVLTGDGASITFRAADITPQQLQILYAVMLPRLRPGSRKNRGGSFFPRGITPLPLPQIVYKDKVLLSFVVGAEKQETGHAIVSSFVRMLPFYLPLFTVIALYSANNIAISPSLTLDIGLNMLIYWVIGMLVLLGGAALAVKKGQNSTRHADPTAAYAFTRDGMARRWAGGTIFVPRAYLKGVCKKKGIRLRTPYGDFYIDWQDVPDKDLLRAILNGDEPTQPPEGDQTNG